MPTEAIRIWPQANDRSIEHEAGDEVRPSRATRDGANATAPVGSRSKVATTMAKVLQGRKTALKPPALQAKPTGCSVSTR